MALRRTEVRDALSQHVLGQTDLSCRRCHSPYLRIVTESLECDPFAPVSPEHIEPRRPGERRATTASGPGYVDPARPHLSWIRLVCEPELRERLIEEATQQRVSMSEVVRRAARRYVGMPE